jgi:hypothetical protein
VISLVQIKISPISKTFDLSDLWLYGCFFI